MIKIKTDEEIEAHRDLMIRFDNECFDKVVLLAKHKESEGWVLEFSICTDLVEGKFTVFKSTHFYSAVISTSSDKLTSTIRLFAHYFTASKYGVGNHHGHCLNGTCPNPYPDRIVPLGVQDLSDK